jgi:hypothetical protein
MARLRFASLRSGVAARYGRLGTLWALLPALAATAAFALLFQVAGRMVTDGGATGLELQKAFTTGRFTAVVTGWGDGVEAFKTSLMMLDFAFPVLYALSLSSLVALAGGREPGRLLLWLAALPWLAAACDWVENLLHLWLLADVHDAADAAAAAFPAAAVFGASLAATVKFALLLAVSAGAVAVALKNRRWWLAVVGTVLFASFTPVLWA